MQSYNFNVVHDPSEGKYMKYVFGPSGNVVATIDVSQKMQRAQGKLLYVESSRVFEFSDDDDDEEELYVSDTDTDSLSEIESDSEEETTLKPTKKPTNVCEYLLQGWCHSFEHFKGESKFTHPKNLIVCKSQFFDGKEFKIDEANFCRLDSCEYQHPSAKQLKTHLLPLWEEAKNMKYLDKKKRNSFVLSPNHKRMKNEKCKEGMKCTNTNCAYQHKATKKKSRHKNYYVETSSQACRCERTESKGPTKLAVFFKNAWRCKFG
jgi:hypothetical protein